MKPTTAPRVNFALLAELDTPAAQARRDEDERIRRQRLAHDTRRNAKIDARDLNTRYGSSR